MKKLLTFLIAFLLMNTCVFAACSESTKAELNQKAANVKATYEVVEIPIKNERAEAIDHKIKISIINADEDLYFVVKNATDETEKEYYYKDAQNGIVSFIWNDASKIAKYNIEVYATKESKCEGLKLKTIYLNTPRYNEFHEREICEELSDFYMCKEFVSFEATSQENFIKQLDSFRSGKINNEGEEVINKTFFDKVFEFLNKYKFIILGGTVIIVGGAIFIGLKKNKKNRELGL